MATRRELAAELNALEPRYRIAKDPAYQTEIKDKTFNRLLEIFKTSNIREPTAAPFTVGRMVESLEDYISMLQVVEKYEKLEADLAALVKLDEARSKANAQGF